MEFYIKVEDNIIADAKFKTFGCGAAIATSSMVTELVKGKTIGEALKRRLDQLFRTTSVNQKEEVRWKSSAP